MTIQQLSRFIELSPLSQPWNSICVPARPRSACVLLEKSSRISSLESGCDVGDVGRRTAMEPPWLTRDENPWHMLIRSKVVLVN